MKREGVRWKILIISLLIVFGIAFLGGVFTSASVDTDWYDSVKPAITPPDWVFPVVWNILFLLIALSLYFSWTGAKKKEKRLVGLAFGTNLFLNALWSFLFFGKQMAVLAFADLILIWISIVLLIYVAGRADRKAGWLLAPYLLWVSFAGVLNWIIAF